MNVVEFADQIVKHTENGKQWKLSDYQRTVLELMYDRYYMTRLWSEPKKSGKTFSRRRRLISRHPPLFR